MNPADERSAELIFDSAACQGAGWLSSSQEVLPLRIIS